MLFVQLTPIGSLAMNGIKPRRPSEKNLQERPPMLQKKPLRPTCLIIGYNKPLRIISCFSTNVTYGNENCNTIVAKFHSHRIKTIKEYSMATIHPFHLINLKSTQLCALLSIQLCLHCYLSHVNTPSYRQYNIIHVTGIRYRLFSSVHQHKAPSFPH